MFRQSCAFSIESVTECQDNLETAPGDAEPGPRKGLDSGDSNALEAAEAPSGDGWQAQRSSDCGWQVELNLAHSASGQAPGMQGLVGSPRSLAVHSPASDVATDVTHAVSLFPEVSEHCRGWSAIPSYASR